MFVMLWLICGLIAAWLFLKLAKEQDGYIDGCEVFLAVLCILAGVAILVPCLGAYLCTRPAVVHRVEALVEWIDKKIG